MSKTNKKQLTTNVSKENWDNLDNIIGEGINVFGNAITKSLVIDLALSLFFKQVATGKTVENIIGMVYGEGGVVE